MNTIRYRCAPRSNAISANPRAFIREIFRRESIRIIGNFKDQERTLTISLVFGIITLRFLSSNGIKFTWMRYVPISLFVLLSNTILYYAHNTLCK